MTPVAYLMSRFPKLTETFILREIIELERQGQPVIILPLLCVRQPVRHADVDQVMAKVHAVPLLSPAILSANLDIFRRSPGRYMNTLWLALRGTWGSANLFIGALGIFPKAVYFARLIEQQGIQHVHAHYATHPALAALVISELTGVSFSFTAHAHDIFVHTAMLSEKLSRARFVVAISEFNKRYLLRMNPAVAEKIHVVHCGVELARYHPQPHRQVAEPLTILCVASLQPYKGLPYLVSACARLRSRLGQFRCLIVGEGREYRSLERLIAHLDLREVVQLLGAQPQERLTSLFGQADLFVLPSVAASDGQMEGIPVALMEAMASGLPVVATRLSGVPELIEDGATGILVPPADEAALAEAMMTLAARDDLRATLGRRGREAVAAQFDLAANVARLRELFSSTDHGWESHVKDLIRQHARQAAPHLEAHQHVTVHLRKQPSGRNSDVYRVTLRNGSPRSTSLILKRHRPPRRGPPAIGGGTLARGVVPSEQSESRDELVQGTPPARPAAEAGLEEARRAAQREYDALSWLWRAFTSRSDRFTVPRPLGLFPELAALLMEPCQGERLDQALRWTHLRIPPWQQARLCQHLKACGEWLGLFHQITERPGDPSPMYKRIEQDFEQELAICRALGLDADLAHHVAQTFADRKHVAFSGAHRLVGRHCDFAPYNVFLSRDHLTAIDFEGLQDGIRYDDLCYFIGVIESTSWYHLSRRLCRRLTASFFEGYQRYGTIDPKHHDLFMLAAMVKSMARSPLFDGTAHGWQQRWKRAGRLTLYRRWFEEHVR